MKDITVADGETRNTDSGIPANIMDNNQDSVPLKSSSLEEIEASHCKEPETLKWNSRSGEKNPLDSVSFTYPLVRESHGTNLCNGGGDLCPMTPTPNGETVKISPAPDQTDDSEVLCECETPTLNTFNPFAPASEELPLAPKKKMPREFKMPTRRKLNFDTCCDSKKKAESTVSDDEDYILESICKLILELVVSNQTREICEDLVDEDSSDDCVSDGFRTPTSVPLLTGIAETCPDAPTRHGSKSRRPDQSICHKLEFESCLI